MNSMNLAGYTRHSSFKPIPEIDMLQPQIEGVWRTLLSLFGLEPSDLGQKTPKLIALASRKHMVQAMLETNCEGLASMQKQIIDGNYPLITLQVLGTLCDLVNALPTQLSGGFRASERPSSSHNSSFGHQSFENRKINETRQIQENEDFNEKEQTQSHSVSIDKESGQDTWIQENFSQNGRMDRQKREKGKPSLEDLREALKIKESKGNEFNREDSRRGTDFQGTKVDRTIKNFQEEQRKLRPSDTNGSKHPLDPMKGLEKRDSRSQKEKENCPNGVNGSFWPQRLMNCDSIRKSRSKEKQSQVSFERDNGTLRPNSSFNKGSSCEKNQGKPGNFSEVSRVLEEIRRENKREKLGIGSARFKFDLDLNGIFNEKGKANLNSYSSSNGEISKKSQMGTKDPSLSHKASLDFSSGKGAATSFEVAQNGRGTRVSRDLNSSFDNFLPRKNPKRNQVSFLESRKKDEMEMEENGEKLIKIDLLASRSSSKEKIPVESKKKSSLKKQKNKMDTTFGQMDDKSPKIEQITREGTSDVVDLSQELTQKLQSIMSPLRNLRNRRASRQKVTIVDPEIDSVSIQSRKSRVSKKEEIDNLFKSDASSVFGLSDSISHLSLTPT